MNNPENYDDQLFINSPWLSENICDWGFIKESGTKSIYKKNFILPPYDSIGYVYYIEKGRLRASVFNADGEEKIIYIVDNGNIFNLTSITDNLPDQLFYTTLTECVLYRINNDALINILKHDAEKSINAIKDLSRVVKILSAHVEDMTFMKASSRVAKCLYMLSRSRHATATKTGIKINIKFTHYEMAIYAGTSRVTVSNILKEMEKSGIIRKSDGYLVIEDIQNLKEYITSSPT